MQKRRRLGTREREQETGRRRERRDDCVLSRRDLAEEVQTRLHLHNRYIPATWTGMEAESSVSSERYIARLVLARWQRDLRRSLEELEREKGKERKRMRYASEGGEGGCVLLTAMRIKVEERTRCPKKLARREKSVGANTRRPMTSSELSGSFESFS